MLAVVPFSGSAAVRPSGRGAVVARAFERVPCSAVKVDAAGRVIVAGSLPALKAARCGYLVVPENRSRPAGRSIRLAVAIVPAVSRKPAHDPVVYLAGGPGGSAIYAAPGLIKEGFNRDRELILMDQRGNLFSKPFLFCPESLGFVGRRGGLGSDAAST